MKVSIVLILLFFASDARATLADSAEHAPESQGGSMIGENDSDARMLGKNDPAPRMAGKSWNTSEFRAGCRIRRRRRQRRREWQRANERREKQQQRENQQHKA